MANEPTPGWTFLSNHTHVLVCLAADGDLTLREVAARVGVTERAVQRIVAELELGGVLERTRDGRRNTYRIDPSVPLRHPLEAHCRIGVQLLRRGQQEVHRRVPVARVQRRARRIGQFGPARRRRPSGQPAR
jgi:hypothetical protein